MIYINTFAVSPAVRTPCRFVRCSATGASRSRKPIRSKHLQPSSPDPESLSVGSQDWTPDETLPDPDEAAHVPVPQPHNRTQLSTSYQILNEENSTGDENTAAGFFFGKREDLIEELDQRRQQSAWTAHAGPPAPLPRYRYAVEEGKVVDMIAVKKAVPPAFERSLVRRAEPQIGSVSRRGGSYQQPNNHDITHGYRDDDILFDGPVESSRPEQPKLKAFPYCIGRNDLFAALWELDLISRVEFVTDMTDADVVIHRRPQPGEKQFQYERFRTSAHSLGIPFVSINAASTAELQKSLVPVLELYDGKLTLPQLLQKRPGKSARIRL